MAATKLPTFDVDKEGLSKLVERRGKKWVLGELWQNAVDENATEVSMTLTLIGGGLAEVAVEDDNPQGFENIAHAYTLFAESLKKDDPTKRGRFNLGEKLVIALCKEARIATTKATIRFDEAGRSMEPPVRKRGSKFEGVFPMTDEEYGEACDFVFTLIPPKGVRCTFNGMEVKTRKPVRVFTASLRTERADAEGVLRPTQRKTEIAVYEPLTGETASLYEMGIPVVETGDRFHVDIAQKVPLNSDRDNVPPFYLRDVRAYVLNHTADMLSEDDAKQTWVTRAIEDEKIDPGAVRETVKRRFGDKVVLADPSDPEAVGIAVTKGYNVVGGGALSKEAWKNVKAAEAIRPAGQVTPSPNPNEGDEEINMLAEEHWPQGVANVASFARWFARELMGFEIDVRIANAPRWPFNATYGGRRLTLNLGALGFRWFENGASAQVINLLIHEFAHEYERNHLDHGYADALTRLAGRAVRLALEQPDAFHDTDALAKEVTA